MESKLNIFDKVRQGVLTNELNNAFELFITFPNMSRNSKQYKLLENEVKQGMDEDELKFHSDRDDIHIHIDIIQAAELYEQMYVKDGEFLLS